MRRLWDDHFRDLGHPPKLYRVQDAGFIGSSSLWWQIVLMKKNIWKIIKNHVFHQKWHKQQEKTAGMLATEVRSGDAPKPKFSMKTNENLKNSEINSRSTIEISPYFWVCLFYAYSVPGIVQNLPGFIHELSGAQTFPGGVSADSEIGMVDRILILLFFPFQP